MLWLLLNLENFCDSMGLSYVYQTLISNFLSKLTSCCPDVHNFISTNLFNCMEKVVLDYSESTTGRIMCLVGGRVMRYFWTMSEETKYVGTNGRCVTPQVGSPSLAIAISLPSSTVSSTTDLINTRTSLKILEYL